MLNRNALILELKQPALDWLHGLLDQENMLTLESASRRQPVYLVDDEPIEAGEAEEWISEHVERVFAEALYFWAKDEATWPEALDKETFSAWFSWTLKPAVLDLVDDPLEDSDPFREILTPELLPGSIAAPIPVLHFTAAVFSVLSTDDEDGELNLGAVIDDVMERVFPRSPDMAPHFEKRFEALLQVLEHKDIEPYVVTKDESMHFHPALLHAAAEVKVSRNGKYPRQQLVERIKKLKLDPEYADWSV